MINASDDGGKDTDRTVNIVITAVNDTPILSNVATDTLLYTENDDPVLLAEEIILEDLENDNIVAATVTINEIFNKEEDELLFEASEGITGRLTDKGLILTGTATLAAYQQVLRTVQYVNNSDTPQPGVRRISFQVTDAGNGSSNNISRFVEVEASDDPIVLSDIEEDGLEYRPGDPQINTTSQLVVSDADDDSLSVAVVQFAPEDYLSEEDSLVFESEAFTYTWNETNGTLIIRGENSLAAYQQALRAVQYINTSSTPTGGSRTIRYTVIRRGVESNTVEREVIVIVNEAPLVSSFEISVLKNSGYTFSADDFANSYQDPDNFPQNPNFVALSISRLPDNGLLLFNGDTISQEMVDRDGGFVVSEDELAALIYQPDTDFIGSDSLSWSASDGEDFATESAQLYFAVNDLQVDAGEDIEICIGDAQTLSVSVMGGSGNYTFQWTCDQTDCNLDATSAAEVTIAPQMTTTYFVTVTDGNGVTSTIDTLVVNTRECYGLPLEIPTAFTPNGDGANDQWEIRNIDTYDSQQVEIFDRHGKRVFRSEGYRQAWDGTFNGRMLPAGTYYFVIQLNGGAQFHRGSVSILK